MKNENQIYFNETMSLMLMKEERERPTFKDLLKTYFFNEEFPMENDHFHPEKMEVSPSKFERREDYNH